MDADRSLRGLMMINRFAPYRVNHIIIPDAPPITLPVIPNQPINSPTGSNYVLLDFGENAINNHSNNPHDSWHSEKNQIIFNYVTKSFRERCTSYQSYKTPTLGNSMVFDVLDAAKKVKADVIYTPYANSAAWENLEYFDFVLAVGSHYDNDGQDDNQVGSDNNRHDITSGPTVFLAHSVACSARRDTPEKFKDSTSEGYGMEFFQDLSPEVLDLEYPDKDLKSDIAAVTTDITGTIVSGHRYTNFTSKIAIGEEFTRYNGNTVEIVTVVEKINGESFRCTPAFTPSQTEEFVIWQNVTLAGYCGAQQESWVVPLIAGKLKVIKMSTNATWPEVRAAARATAKRNITNIPEIDNVSWDIYRGFGCIQVQDAIDYINALN